MVASHQTTNYSSYTVVLNCTYNDANNTYIDNVTLFKARAHKNGQLELERATPIEARSPGQITEVY